MVNRKAISRERNKRAVENNARRKHQHHHQGGEKRAEHGADGAGVGIAMGMIVLRKPKPSRNIQNMPPHSRLVSTTTSDTRNQDATSVCRSKVATMRRRIR